MINFYAKYECIIIILWQILRLSPYLHCSPYILSITAYIKDNLVLKSSVATAAHIQSQVSVMSAVHKEDSSCPQTNKNSANVTPILGST